MAVILHGSISVFSPRGTYQINCVSMEPAGSGALAKAYEQLKSKLSAKGYFDASAKKPMPSFVEHIALVTSATGAALQDMLRVAQKRWPLVKITLVDALVQGDSARYSIANAIQKADSIGADVIVVGRGGGSIEDLWAFNEEVVADAIFRAQTPIVSAVGHEIDYVISDFVADLRAPTPSAAMEMLLPDQAEMLVRLDGLMEHFHTVMRRSLHTQEQRLTQLKHLFAKHSIEHKMALWKSEINLLHVQMNERLERLFKEKSATIVHATTQMHFEMRQKLASKEQLLKTYQMALASKEPTKEQKECYAQVVRKGKKIALESIGIDEEFELQTPQTILVAKAISKRSGESK